MPVSCDPLPRKKLAATLAVVVTLPANDTKLPVYVGKYAVTLVLLYIPVSCDPLPRKKLAATLAVVVTLPVSAAKLPVYVGKYAVTLVLLYIPVSCDPLPRIFCPTIFPDADKVPVPTAPATVTLPRTVNKLATELNVSAGEAAALPSELKRT